MEAGFFTISDAHDPVRIVCERCSRAGRYRKAELIAAHGDVTLPTLLAAITADCPNKFTGGNLSVCNAHFAPESLP